MNNLRLISPGSKRILIVLGIALGLVAAAATIRSAVEPVDAASVIGRCAQAMGGADKIAAVRGLRLEVVYADHDQQPVIHEIRRPHQIRTERAGDYISIFDGERGGFLQYDKSKPDQPPVSRAVPPEAARGFETDLVWFFPSFFDFPTEYAGQAEVNGAACHKLVTTLPLGNRAEYLIDARTFLIKTVALSETFKGQTFRMEREWLDLKPVQGILFPTRMTYPGRGNTTATAEIRKVEINPALSEDRFRVPDTAK